MSALAGPTSRLRDRSFGTAARILCAACVGHALAHCSTGLILAAAEATSTTAPLPVFGFRLDYAITPKWLVRTKYELFFLDNFDTYRGALNDFTIAIEHHTFKHVGFGFGLNRSSLDLEIDEDNKRGAFSTVLSGLMLYVTMR